MNKKEKEYSYCGKGVNVMKRTTVIGILFFVFLGIVAFTGAYTLTYFQMKQQLKEREVLPETMETTNQGAVTTSDTEYVVETYDIYTNEIEEIAYNIPSEFIGYTREEIVEKFQQFEDNPSIEDLEIGFVDYSVVYFSPERLVIRKNYDSSNAGYKYCILSERGLLTVYYIDRKTVYEYTNIETAHLPTDVQLEVIEGKRFKSLKEVFSFLETYSS